jgi:hypothetical protein
MQERLRWIERRSECKRPIVAGVMERGDINNLSEPDFRLSLRATTAHHRHRFKRRVSVGDLLTDRWEIAREYGWGEGTSCYDNVLVIGDVRVGKHTWIGPNVILDGSGGLEIGDY